MSQDASAALTAAPAAESAEQGGLPFLPDNLFDGVGTLALSIFEIAAAVGLLYLAHRYLTGLAAGHPSRQFRVQLGMAALTFFGIILVLTVLPINDELRGQLLSLVGILISAAIALSASSFIGNAMAGIMLRALSNFRPGDFIRAGEHFGRVTEMDLLHTELQTKDRNLTTLPNLFLVSNPMTVVRSSGTVVHIDLSLGYDVSRNTVERLLLSAAAEAELEEPFVQIRELGDFSVTYRICGFLVDLKKLTGQRSRLRATVLDALHGAGIEIVSPTVMMTRARPADDQLMPTAESAAPAEILEEARPEARIFDKAQKAESIESLRKRREEIQAQIAELEAAAGGGDKDEIERLKRASESLKAAILASEKRIATES